MKNNLILASFILAFGFFFGAKTLANSLIKFKNFDRYVEVKGLAEKTVKSDLASWGINYDIAGDDLQSLYEKINDNKEIIVKFLLKNGFSIQEISQNSINVTDNYANQYVAISDKLQRYKISVSLNLVSKNVDLVVNALKNSMDLINDGIPLTYNNVSYFFNALNDIKAEMIDEATKNAKVSAEVFAKNTNSKIKGIKQANQGLFSISSNDGMYQNDTATLWKKVRVVSTVQFFLD